ncbi:unnamed protein product [Diatraea saccharalis]|uniref:Salivary secreted peptide n=2 Tax=Diatraea saccharalis TaxID=40085 RepID=A0A9P0C8P5_9NEOP|nr:unnamed protein product [Diatraea saccharalis]
MLSIGFGYMCLFCLQMRFSILLVLSALAIIQASVIKAPTSRANLNVGYAAAGDRLLYRTYIYKPAIPNSVQREDLVYRGNSTTRISAITATEVGYTQYATAWVISGSIGANNVTIRFQSALGWGYYFLVDIWGR